MLQRTEIVYRPGTSMQQQQQSAVRKIRAVFATRNIVVCAYAQPADAAHCLLCSEAENKPPPAHGAVAQQLGGLVSRELLLLQVY